MKFLAPKFDFYISVLAGNWNSTQNGRIFLNRRVDLVCQILLITFSSTVPHSSLETSIHISSMTVIQPDSSVRPVESGSESTSTRPHSLSQAIPPSWHSAPGIALPDITHKVNLISSWQFLKKTVLTANCAVAVLETDKLLLGKTFWNLSGISSWFCYGISSWFCFGISQWFSCVYLVFILCLSCVYLGLFLCFRMVFLWFSCVFLCFVVNSLCFSCVSLVYSCIFVVFPCIFLCLALLLAVSNEKDFQSCFPFTQSDDQTQVQNFSCFWAKSSLNCSAIIEILFGGTLIARSKISPRWFIFDLAINWSSYHTKLSCTWVGDLGIWRWKFSRPRFCQYRLEDNCLNYPDLNWRICLSQPQL